MSDAREMEALDALARAAQVLRRDWNEGGMARAFARDAFMQAVDAAPLGARAFFTASNGGPA